ncbi:MAG: restriction endonuclease subunit S [Patescibacteria group bacterium]|nr:restriction endonuclease subunit S [Patescibacteria group bacterium]
MKEKLVPSAWLEKEGRRLDCGPYVSGAIEARVLLGQLPVKKTPLQALTAGHDGGIYNGPQFVRRYVDGEQHGVRFLTSSSMLLADLRLADLLKRSDAHSSRLAHLRLSPSMILISCSGTIGRMSFARADMDGMWSSQDILKIVAAPKRVKPGFLYAYLSSRFGVPLVTGGTYGAIIQHLEPQHIADLPVPEAPADIQDKAHALVVRAADARTTAIGLIIAAEKRVAEAWGLGPQSADPARKAGGPDILLTQASALAGRFDAHFHSSPARAADEALGRLAHSIEVKRLGDVVESVFETPRFGRIPVEDPKYGVPFMSISDLARIDPIPSGLISKRQAVAMKAIVEDGWLILPRVGQLQGLFGHVVAVPPHLRGLGVSDNNIRVVPRSKPDSGYLFAALSTKISYWQIVRRACGTSIPYLDAARVSDVPVPWVGSDERAKIGALVNEAMALRSRARHDEREAVVLVERWIEGMGGA